MGRPNTAPGRNRDPNTDRNTEYDENKLTWLIIALVLVVAIGPVLYLLPTAKDKRLTGLRETARRLGLTVRLTRVRKLNPAPTERVNAAGEEQYPTTACVSYAWPIKTSLHRFQDLQLLKEPADVSVPCVKIVPGWVLGEVSEVQGEGVDLRSMQPMLSEMKALMDTLPDDTLGVELSRRFVACLWQEKAAVESSLIDEMAQTCRKMEQLLAQYLHKDTSNDS